MFLMDLKGAFDHVNRKSLIRNMETLEVDEDLVRWTESFMSERSVSLVVDSQPCVTAGVEMGVLQGLPVSPILFAVYLYRIFKEVEEEVKGCMALWFSNDC